MAFVQGRIQRCADGQGIYANLSDNVGNISTTDLYGFWHSYYAYPGYTLNVGAAGYFGKTYMLSNADVSAGWVTICLEARPAENTGGGGGGIY
jgi:hypothetical protein